MGWEKATVSGQAWLPHSASAVGSRENNLSFLKPYLARFPFEAAEFWPGHIEKKNLRGPPPYLILLLLCCVSPKNCFSTYHLKTFVYKLQFWRMCSGNQLVFLPPPQLYFSFSHPFTRYLQLAYGQCPTSGLLSLLRQEMPESTLFHSLTAILGSPGVRVVRADRRQLTNGSSNYEGFYGFQYSKMGCLLCFKTFDIFPSNTCGLKKGFYGKQLHRVI